MKIYTVRHFDGREARVIALDFRDACSAVGWELFACSIKSMEDIPFFLLERSNPSEYQSFQSLESGGSRRNQASTDIPKV